MASDLEAGKFVIEQEYPNINEDLRKIEIVDSDEDFEEEPMPEHRQEFIEENFVDVFNGILNKYKFDEQVEYSEKFLMEELKKKQGKVIFASESIHLTYIFNKKIS